MQSEAGRPLERLRSSRGQALAYAICFALSPLLGQALTTRSAGAQQGVGQDPISDGGHDTRPRPDGLTTTGLYKEGQSARWLVDGSWRFSRTPNGAGRNVKLPFSWNATDQTARSFKGGVGFYRKAFRLPGSARATWIVRFESVNFRAIVYVNGHEIARHVGAYAPFEVVLPRALLKAGVNRLMVRADSRREATDVPPAGRSRNGEHIGGWWNYGGILREVYLRRVDGVDLERVLVRPTVLCGTCPAQVTYEAEVRNHGDRVARVSVRSRLDGLTVELGSATVAAGRVVTLRRRITVAQPRLWSPQSPYLYDTSFTLAGRGHQTYRLRSGLRTVRLKNGRLQLNGQYLRLRGYGLHEDSSDRGAAIDNSIRERQIQFARNSGALVLRGHYQLHPYYYERADELGMLIWGEVPVYLMKTSDLTRRRVREAAIAQIEALVSATRNHPSALVHSIGNELNANVGHGLLGYFRQAKAAARRLDPTRPVALAIKGDPLIGCQRRGYGHIQVLGINEYFGWYNGGKNQIADQSKLSGYLDGVRRCYPHKAILVTEYGAEANRSGPLTEKGTYEFQQAWIAYHTSVFDSKPWLSGALYWALQEFRVRPGWKGGNPRSSPPLHQKGVVTFGGQAKPAYATLASLFGAVQQVGAP